jgi:hypothetical protein
MHVLHRDPSDPGEQGQGINKVLWATVSQDDTDITKAADQATFQTFPVNKKRILWNETCSNWSENKLILRIIS